MSGASAVSVVVIAKAPAEGQVKTRLCPPCTPGQASELARVALEDTLTTVARCVAGRRVLALEGSAGDWLPAGVEVLAQRGDGLAERIANVYAAIGGPILLIGMDTPQLTPALLNEALAMTASAGATLGAATDGGYWALGMQNADPAALEGVPMSSPYTFEVQRSQLAHLGLGVALLPPLRDVDDFDDAVAVAAQAPDGRFARAVRRLADGFAAGGA